MSLKPDMPIPRGYGKTLPVPTTQFPDYEFSEYPKQITQEVTTEVQESWRERNAYIDDRTGKKCYRGGLPHLKSRVAVLSNEADVEAGIALTVGAPLIVQSPAQEEIARRNHDMVVAAAPAPAKAVTMDVNTVATLSDADLDAENERLRRELRGDSVNGVNPDKAPRGGKPKPKPKGKARVDRSTASIDD